MTITEYLALPERSRDALVAERVFEQKGLGYYGPPDEGPFTHDRSTWHATKEEADASYAAHWDRTHQADSFGFVGRDDWDAELCWWKDGWGPIACPDYSTDAADDCAVLVRVRETWGSSRQVAFAVMLKSIWNGRDGHPFELYYRPGDWSLAALLALE